MASLNSKQLRPFLETAHALADLAGKAILPHFRKRLEIENKAAAGSFDPVTNADKAAERAIRRHLASAHPEHGILGEEYGGLAGSAPFTWVIDPIDGTKAFITGAPLWGTLIGLAHSGTAVLGMMDQPFTQERIWAAGAASHWRVGDGPARRLKTRACGKLGDAILATTSPDLLSEVELPHFDAIKKDARLTRYGGDCYAYCLLAAGTIDVIVECGLKPHDVMALIPIIEQAGGRITTWTGESAEGGGRIVAAGDPRLHARLLRQLSQAPGQ